MSSPPRVATSARTLASCRSPAEVASSEAGARGVTIQGPVRQTRLNVWIVGKVNLRSLYWLRGALPGKRHYGHRPSHGRKVGWKKAKMILSREGGYNQPHPYAHQLSRVDTLIREWGGRGPQRAIQTSTKKTPRGTEGGTTPALPLPSITRRQRSPPWWQLPPPPLQISWINYDIVWFLIIWKEQIIRQC